MTCVTASPSLGFQLLQNRQRQVYNSSVKVAVVEKSGEKTTTFAYQVKKESVQPHAKTTEERMPSPIQQAHHRAFFSM